MSDDKSEFFRMVHRLMEERGGQPRENIEGRQTQRSPYSCYQTITPYTVGQSPDPNKVQEVRCFDISPGGFSFLSPHPPTERSLMVALGVPPNLTYVSARIVHERPLWLVGCCFTHRMEETGA